MNRFKSATSNGEVESRIGIQRGGGDEPVGHDHSSVITCLLESVVFVVAAVATAAVLPGPEDGEFFVEVASDTRDEGDRWEDYVGDEGVDDAGECRCYSVWDSSVNS